MSRWESEMSVDDVAPRVAGSVYYGVDKSLQSALYTNAKMMVHRKMVGQPQEGSLILPAFSERKVAALTEVFRPKCANAGVGTLLVVSRPIRALLMMRGDRPPDGKLETDVMLASQITQSLESGVLSFVSDLPPSVRASQDATVMSQVLKGQYATRIKRWASMREYFEQLCEVMRKWKDGRDQGALTFEGVGGGFGEVIYLDDYAIMSCDKAMLWDEQQLPRDWSWTSRDGLAKLVEPSGGEFPQDPFSTRRSGTVVFTLVTYYEVLDMLEVSRRRFNNYLAAASLAVEHSSSAPPPELIDVVFEFGDRSLFVDAKQGFKNVRQIENVIKQASAMVNDPVNDSSARFAIFQAIDDAYQNRGAPGDVMPRLAHLLGVLAGYGHNEGVYGELFGCAKSFVKPELYAQDSGEAKLKKEAAVRVPTMDGMSEATGEFVKSTIFGMIDAGRGWPAIDEGSLDKIPEVLQSLLRAKPPVLPDDYYRIPPAWFCNVDFEQTHHPDPVINKPDLQADRACSVDEEHLPGLYSGLVEGLEEPDGFRNETRRLLLQSMNAPDIDAVDLVTQFAEGRAPRKWFTSLIRLKNGEFKFPAGRPFTMDHFRLRDFFAILEFWAKLYFFPFLPFILMSADEVELKEKMGDVGNKMGVERGVVASEGDFEEWNQSFWPAITSGYNSIGRKMSQLIGIPNAWECIHHVFKMTIIAIVGDGVAPRYWDEETWQKILLRVPGVHMDNIIFSGVFVGQEGKSQGFWTIISGCMAKAACFGVMYLVSFLFYITGDNLVLWRAFHMAFAGQDAESREVLGKLLYAMALQADRELEEKMLEVGIKMGAADGCITSLVASWCKNWFGPRGSLSGTLRASAKLDVEITTFAEELEAEWASLVAAGYGVTYKSLFWKASVFLSLVELSRFTRERVFEDVSLAALTPAQSRSLMQASILAPSESGAMPGYNVIATLVRSEKQITSVMSHLKICEAGGMHWAKEMRHFILSGGSLSDERAPALTEVNPRALNVERPRRPGNYVSAVVSDALEGTITNPIYAGAYAITRDPKVDGMIQLGKEMRPLFPEAISDGAASAAVGQARAIQSSVCRRGTYKRTQPMEERVIAKCLHLDKQVTKHHIAVCMSCVKGEILDVDRTTRSRIERAMATLLSPLVDVPGVPAPDDDSLFAPLTRPPGLGPLAVEGCETLGCQRLVCKALLPPDECEDLSLVQGLVTPSPFEAGSFQWFPCVQDYLVAKDGLKEHLVLYTNLAGTEGSDPTYCSGLEPADIGSFTGDKRPEKFRSVFKTDAPIKGLCRLSELASDFLQVGGDAWLLFYYQALSRCEVTEAEFLDLSTAMTGGSLVHRLQSIMIRAAVSMGLIANSSRHGGFSPNSMGNYSGGNTEVTFFFQFFRSTMNALRAIILNRCPDLLSKAPVLVWKLSCPSCLMPVYTGPIHLKTCPDDLEILSWAHRAFYIPREKFLLAMAGVDDPLVRRVTGVKGGRRRPGVMPGGVETLAGALAWVLMVEDCQVKRRGGAAGTGKVNLAPQETRSPVKIRIVAAAGVRQLLRDMAGLRFAQVSIQAFRHLVYGAHDVTGALEQALATCAHGDLGHLAVASMAPQLSGLFLDEMDPVHLHSDFLLNVRSTESNLKSEIDRMVKGCLRRDELMFRIYPATESDEATWACGILCADLLRAISRSGTGTDPSSLKKFAAVALNIVRNCSLVTLDRLALFSSVLLRSPEIGLESTLDRARVAMGASPYEIIKSSTFAPGVTTEMRVPRGDGDLLSLPERNYMEVMFVEWWLKSGDEKSGAGWDFLEQSTVGEPLEFDFRVNAVCERWSLAGYNYLELAEVLSIVGICPAGVWSDLSSGSGSRAAFLSQFAGVRQVVALGVSGGSKLPSAHVIEAMPFIYRTISTGYKIVPREGCTLYGSTVYRTPLLNAAPQLWSVYKKLDGVILDLRSIPRSADVPRAWDDVKRAVILAHSHSASVFMLRVSVTTVAQSEAIVGTLGGFWSCIQVVKPTVSRSMSQWVWYVCSVRRSEPVAIGPIPPPSKLSPLGAMWLKDTRSTISQIPPGLGTIGPLVDWTSRLDGVVDGALASLESYFEETVPKTTAGTSDHLLRVIMADMATYSEHSWRSFSRVVMRDHDLIESGGRVQSIRRNYYNESSLSNTMITRGVMLILKDLVAGWAGLEGSTTYETMVSDSMASMSWRYQTDLAQGGVFSFGAKERNFAPSMHHVFRVASAMQLTITRTTSGPFLERNQATTGCPDRLCRLVSSLLSELCVSEAQVYFDGASRISNSIAKVGVLTRCWGTQQVVKKHQNMQRPGDERGYSIESTEKDWLEHKEAKVFTPPWEMLPPARSSLSSNLEQAIRNSSISVIVGNSEWRYGYVGAHRKYCFVLTEERISCVVYSIRPITLTAASWHG